MAKDEPVVAYCGGGISATVDLFALVLAGAQKARLYDGSLASGAQMPRCRLVTAKAAGYFTVMLWNFGREPPVRAGPKPGGHFYRRRRSWPNP